ncbi:MAG: Sensor protein PhoQ, partial [Pseudomonadota bacterium]
MIPKPGSLRLRLLAATVATLFVALSGAHWWLSGLFREHVFEQFDLALSRQLDQLTARLEFDARGLPVIGPKGMSDPRFDRPYSGLYWQVDRLFEPTGRDEDAPGEGRLRSRSLWDVDLRLPDDTPADGAVHRHLVSGPRGEQLRVVERSLRLPDSDTRWRLIVADDLRDSAAAIERFTGVLAGSLAALGGLLALAALAQVGVGLAPLQAMRTGLQRVRAGEAQRLEGRFPSEVQPLIDEFNGVLDRNAEVVTRARAQAGNLAHALKTPLAILDQAARRGPPDEIPALVIEQVQAAQRQLQWHLARARAAAAQNLPGQRTPVEPLLTRLLRTMDRLHADRHLDLGTEDLPSGLAFAGEAQDLQEMLGNLLDNACRSARSSVLVRVALDGPSLSITVDDD